MARKTWRNAVVVVWKNMPGGTEQSEAFSPHGVLDDTKTITSGDEDDSFITDLKVKSTPSGVEHVFRKNI